MERRFRKGTSRSPRNSVRNCCPCGLSFSEAEKAEDESLEAYFNLRAARRGMEAHGKLAESASRRRLSGDKNYYQDIATAARIAGYVDSYYSRLLSASLQSGEIKYRDVVKRSAELRAFSIAGIGLFGVIFAVFAVAFSASVAKPIIRLAEASARMAAGDLAVGTVDAATGMKWRCWPGRSTR
jgi:methyl-accepting chemotaxis protein